MISGANILIFDEPTNHLDMESITALNNGMMKFPRCDSLCLSRPPDCTDHCKTVLWKFFLNGVLIDKITTYDEYLASDEMARKRQVYTMTEEDN